MKNMNKISNKKHWELVMHKDNLNPIIKALNNFYKKEEYKIYKEYVKD